MNSNILNRHQPQAVRTINPSLKISDSGNCLGVRWLGLSTLTGGAKYLDAAFTAKMDCTRAPTHTAQKRGVDCQHVIPIHPGDGKWLL